MPINIYSLFSISDIKNYMIGKLSIKVSKFYKTKASTLFNAEYLRLEILIRC